MKAPVNFLAIVINGHHVNTSMDRTAHSKRCTIRDDGC